MMPIRKRQFQQDLPTALAFHTLSLEENGVSLSIFLAQILALRAADASVRGFGASAEPRRTPLIEN